MTVALLDTSVLWPSLQRDFLLSLAIEGLYRPVWSEAIIAELEFHEAAKLRKRGIASSDADSRAAHLVDRMRCAFGDAIVAGWERLEGSYGLPDPNDEHVVAAAQVAGAGAIVTANLKDFPSSHLPDGLTAISAAQFAYETVATSPIQAVTAISRIASRSGRAGPRLTENDILDILQKRYQMGEAMAAIRAHFRDYAEERSSPIHRTSPTQSPT